MTNLYDMAYLAGYEDGTQTLTDHVRSLTVQNRVLCATLIGLIVIMVMVASRSNYAQQSIFSRA